MKLTVYIDGQTFVTPDHIEIVPHGGTLFESVDVTGKSDNEIEEIKKDILNRLQENDIIV